MVDDFAALRRYPEEALWPDERAAFARTTDPDTSHEAARAVRPGGKELQAAIREFLARDGGRWTAETIATFVNRRYPRWEQSTIISACNPKRSGLVVVGHTINSRGRRVQLLALP